MALANGAAVVVRRVAGTGSGSKSGPVAVNAVLVGRRPTGEIYGPELAARYPERDWILTRILWLTGLESGFNRGGSADTLRRFIYIHVLPGYCADGPPAFARGCIRMRNQDLLDLSERVATGDRVFIAG